MGKEPVLAGERVLGYVTSAAFGYSVGRSIIYSYLPAEYARPGTALEVQYFGRRYGVTVVREPLYDPRQTRLRG
jgi:glycine cleavage system aminomethyltransferase T